MSPVRAGVGGNDDPELEAEAVLEAVFVLPYSLLKSSAERACAVEQHPSPSHHRMKAFQCLSFLRVDESPTTISPDLARVTEIR